MQKLSLTALILSCISMLCPAYVSAGELRVAAKAGYGPAIGDAGIVTSFPMYDSSIPYDTSAVIESGPKPVLTSPENSQLLIGNEFKASAWGLASPGVLKTRAIIEANPIAVLSNDSYSGRVISGAYFGDSLTYS